MFLVTSLQKYWTCWQCKLLFTAVLAVWLMGCFSPAFFLPQQPLANSPRPGCHSSGKFEGLILCPVSAASQQKGVISSNALNVSCGDAGISWHVCFNCYLLQELESTGTLIVIHKHLSACRFLLGTHIELVAVVLLFFPFLVCVPRSSVCAVGWEGAFLQLVLIVLFFSPAIRRALREHTAGPHPDQGQLCGPGGHCCHQGHLPQVPQQVCESSMKHLEALVC